MAKSFYSCNIFSDVTFHCTWRIFLQKYKNFNCYYKNFPNALGYASIGASVNFSGNSVEYPLKDLGLETIIWPIARQLITIERATSAPPTKEIILVVLATRRIHLGVVERSEAAVDEQRRGGKL